jgi:hypothetical protein
MNQKAAKRLLRKKKKKVPSKYLLQLMAESVYVYMAKNFFVPISKN